MEYYLYIIKYYLFLISYYLCIRNIYTVYGIYTVKKINEKLLLDK